MSSLLDYGLLNQSPGRDIWVPTNFLFFYFKQCYREYSSLYVYMNLLEHFFKEKIPKIKMLDQGVFKNWVLVETE